MSGLFVKLHESDPRKPSVRHLTNASSSPDPNRPARVGVLVHLDIRSLAEWLTRFQGLGYSNRVRNA